MHGLLGYLVQVNGAAIKQWDKFEQAEHQARHWKGRDPSRDVVVIEMKYDAEGSIRSRGWIETGWREKIERGHKAADWETCGITDCDGFSHREVRL